MKAGKQSRNVSHKVSLTENSETTQIKIFDEELSDSSKTPVEEKLRVVAPSLKANHLHKMNVVQQNAVKKKSMFTHSVPYDSNRSTKKASLDSFYHSNSLKNLNLTERRNEKPA